MIKILSIDVGIKNLALCLFNVCQINKSITIEKWDTIDILNYNEQPHNIVLCNFINKQQSKKQKQKILCQKIAKYVNPINKDEYYCPFHSKKTSFLIPSKELSISYISKCNLFDLCKLADKYEIKYDKPIKKNALFEIVKNYINNNCLTIIEKHKIKKFDMKEIAINIDSYFRNLVTHSHKIDHVIIEQQITSVMRNIQMMLMQFFITSNLAYKIDFISATKKLQITESKYTIENFINPSIKINFNTLNNNLKLTSQKETEIIEEKETETKIENIKGKKMYSKRKKQGIENCKTYLQSNDMNFLNSHKKKDDLADCFLQGIWFINNHF